MRACAEARRDGAKRRPAMRERARRRGASHERACGVPVRAHFFFLFASCRGCLYFAVGRGVNERCPGRKRNTQLMSHLGYSSSCDGDPALPEGALLPPALAAWPSCASVAFVLSPRTRMMNMMLGKRKPLPSSEFLR